MTRFTQPSFSVGARGSQTQAKAYCGEHGHTLPDARGKCLRCGASVRMADVVDSWPQPATEKP